MEKNQHRRFTRLMAILLAALLVFQVDAGMVSVAHAKPTRTLKVAFSEVPGISTIDQYGNHVGLMVDYLNEIAKYTGWAYDYISTSSTELVDEFLAGKYDLMGGAFYSPGFEQYFAYPNYNTGRSIAMLICKTSDETIKGYDLTTLNGKTIGVYERATEKIHYLQEYLASNGLDCRLRYYAYEDLSPAGDLYDHLRAGEVDMLLGNEMSLESEFHVVTTFNAQPYYIVTTVGNTEILDGLNSALEHILESNPTFADTVFNANFPDIQTIDIQLNNQELAYIAQKKTLSVAIPRIWHPLYCENVPGDHHDGVLPAILQSISEFTGLTFTYVYADTYAQCIELVQNGQADILGAYLGTSEQAFDNGLSLSRSYVSLSTMILKHKVVSYPSEGLVCGILSGWPPPPSLQASNIRTYAKVADLAAAVNNHEVDYIYSVSAVLEQEIQTHRYVNVVPVSQTSESVDVGFAIAQPIVPELLTLLNKSISNISTEQRTALLSQNLISIGYTNLTLSDFMYEHPFAFALVLLCVLAVVAAALLVMYRNRMRNALMQSKLDAAEAKSEAKSEFLSRMSHEIRTPMNAILGLTDLACMERDVPEGVSDKLRKIHSSSQYLLSLINDILDMSRIENQKMEIDKQNFCLSAMLTELEDMMGTQAAQKGLNFKVECQAEHDWLLGDPIRLRQILTNLLSNAIKFTTSDDDVTLHVEELFATTQEATYYFSVADTGLGIPKEDLERIFVSFEQVATPTAYHAGTGLGLAISRNLARMMGGDLEVESEYGKGTTFFMTLTFPLGTPDAPLSKATSSEPVQSLKGMHLLLAEDNDLNAEIAGDLLGIHGIEIDRAANGQQAVDMLTNSAPGTYHAVLMDIRMPVLDGYQATKAIRESGHPDAKLPIIAMTADSFKKVEAEALEVGMTGFVSKPVDVSHLICVLSELR